MKKLTSSEIRRMFLDFFESKGHLIVPSAPLIPDNDPSILWINAGVAPLKKYFDGTKVPPSKRLANVQKCIRTNDIENVGDTYHHTFFEMLGNFSIGDYFSSEALEYAYELLTSDKYYGIDKNKLYVTVYPDDTKTYDKWLSLGLDESHIIKCKGNFWDIGPGPCGPDTEIFFDRGEEYDKRGPELIENEIDNDRYIEIWNNVFSKYNHIEGLSREEFPELPHKNIDTGMGLERLVCALQNKKTNYDTDLFSPIINKLEELTNIKYTDQKEFRAIADHIKTLTFALSDGASFSNEGRGYVLRRILRRASRFGRNLGLLEPFMYKLTDSVIQIMEDAYPYLKENKDFVDREIKKEEETFLKTLDKGEKRLKELTLSGKEITGEDVFKLYDTYGFPYELTKEILEESNITVNKEDFDKCMQKQKEMARKASKKVSGMNVQGDVVSFDKKTIFTGYDELITNAKVLFVADSNGNKADIYSDGIVIFDKTPFYATKGGQESDIGFIYGDDFKAEVLKVLENQNGAFMHHIRIITGSIKENDVLTLEVDKEYRFTTCQNHSATHLLHKALKDVLGKEVNQKGSYVDNETLRFDFNYSGNLKDEDIIKIEESVNEQISLCLTNNTKVMNLEDAKKQGAIALFSEKYKESVRVVSFGDSTELCGGTHVANSGDIRKFAIKSVESKGLNIFRIEAVCDTNLESELFSIIKPYNDEMIMLLKKSKKIIKEAKEKDIDLYFDVNISNERPKCYKDILENKNEVETLRKKIADLQKDYSEALVKKALKDINLYLDKKKNGKYGEVVILEFNDYDMNVLKQICSNVSSRLENGICFITNIKESSVNFIAKANDNLKDKVNMGTLIKEVSTIAEGSGGGSKVFAQGGGVNTTNMNIINEYIKQELIEE